MMAVQWLIPDTSHHLRDKIRKEAYLTNEIIIEQERKRAQAMNRGQVGSKDFLKGERNAVANTGNRLACKRRQLNDTEEIALSDLHIV
jgi:anoctamin-1